MVTSLSRNKGPAGMEGALVEDQKDMRCGRGRGARSKELLTLNRGTSAHFANEEPPLTFLPDPLLLLSGPVGLRIQTSVFGFSRISMGPELSPWPCTAARRHQSGLGYGRLPVALTFPWLTPTHLVSRHVGFDTRSCLSAPRETHEGVKRKN